MSTGEKILAIVITIATFAVGWYIVYSVFIIDESKHKSNEIPWSTPAISASDAGVRAEFIYKNHKYIMFEKNIVHDPECEIKDQVRSTRQSYVW